MGEHIRLPKKAGSLNRAVFTLRSHVNIMGKLLLLACFILCNWQSRAQGTWVPVTRTAPHYNAGVMLLLTDGTVLCKTSSGGTGYGTTWDRLTPDSHGSYINGTWSTIAPMHNERLYFSSQVLLDGRVYIAGGEYGDGGPKSEVWDPKTNVWTMCPQIVVNHKISDANSIMLPDGTILQAVVDTASTRLNFIYNPVTNTYAHTGTCLRGDNEAVWVKLPDNSTIFVDNYGTTSERFIPATHTWINDGTVPVSLYDPYGSETGAGFLLPNGKIYMVGSPGTSAFYTPTGTTSPGTWTAGPGLPNGWGAPDAASAMMPNGKILMALSPPPRPGDHFPDSTVFYEFDYITNTYTLLDAPGVTGDTITGPCFITNMLSLPDGTILYTRQGRDQYFEYVPSGSPLAAGKPTITNILTNTCSNYSITGTLFNGISEGASYGDDWQMSTNYPIVRLTSGTNVYYATTSYWNRPGAVMTGSALDTAKFDLPAGLPAGTYSVQVVANGIASDNFTFTTNPVAIAPVAAAICTGGAVSLTDATAGGTWTSSNTAVGTVDASGAVSGLTAGTTVISYTVTGGCRATATVNVLVTPTPISGIAYTSIGGTSFLNDAIPLGTWTSSNTGIATVNGTTGVVTGVAAGTATITYTNICGFATATYTVVPGTLCSATGSAPYASCNSYALAFKSVDIDGDAGTSISDSARCDGTGYIDQTEFGCTLHSGGVYGVAISTGGNAVFTQFWIDFNQDGVFQSTETVGGNTTSFANYGSTTITVPGGATSGTYKMRGVLSFSGSGHYYPTMDPCMTGYSYGEARDYAITIVPAPALTFTGPPTKTVCQNSSANDINANLTINDAAVTGSETWTIVSGPAHGTLGGFPAVGTATGGAVTPTGCTYTPTAGYAGTDAVKIMCTNSASTSATQTIAITVTALPNPGTVGGVKTVCVGATTALSTSGSSGGTWSSTVPAKGTVSTSGVVTGIAAGTTTISYGVTNSCGTLFSSAIVTVNAAASAGTISGASAVCAGATITLSDATGGGVWSSTNTAAGTVSTGGVVRGIAAGTTTISYTVTNSCGAAAATKVVTVNPLPVAGSVTGVATTCAGGTTALTDAASGGVWSSTNPAVGTVSASGVVSGIATGTTTISYTVTNGCGTVAATKIVSVNSTTTVGSISGGNTLCIGATVNFSDATGGGVWSSANPATGTISVGGVFTGLAAGTTTISYTVSNSCGTATATLDVTVNAGTADAGTITGTGAICPTATLSLTDLVGGGVWSSSASGIATVASTGIVTGVAAGTATISYTVSGSCGSIAATTVVTVNPATSAGTITGPATVLVGSNITLTDAVAGGTWGASNGNATVTGGLVTGVAAGTVTISYSVTGTCGTATATRLVTVGTSTTTVTVAAITGYYFYLCVGATTPFFDATAGGVWSINAADAGVASVSASGVVSGISAGTARLSYTVGTGYATATVTVYPLPSPIAGNASLCQGATSALSDATPGGVWTSGIPSIASVSSGGLVTGVTVGTAPIYYTLTAPAGCRTALVVTVNANPAVITGPTNVCVGSTIVLSDVTAGGLWSSASGSITIDGSGNVTGVSVGPATVTYALSSGCARTWNISVNQVPSAISGNTLVCQGRTTLLSDAVTGGTAWTSGSTTVATVSASGMVSGVSVGTATITYAITATGCKTTTIVTVTAMPGAITNNSPICMPSVITLSDATGGGSWASSNISVATVDAVSGTVTGIANGTATISYSVAGAGCFVTTVVTVNAGAGAGAGTISGSATVCVGATTALTDAVPGGTWSSTNMAIGTVSASGVVKGLTPGTTTISYTVTNSCGTAAATAVVSVNPLPVAGTISGSGPVCVGSAITLSDPVAGGGWSSSNSNVTVDGSGNVTGVTAGTSVISYTVTNSCGSATATAVVTVNGLTAGTIGGASSVTVGLSIMLTDAVAGGVWSAGNSNATVSPTGLVTGVAAGTVTISYTVTTGCGSVSATYAVTVNASSVSPITGTFGLCIGTTTALSDVTPGGVWSSSNTFIATVGTSGIVTGVAAGTTTISYTVAGIPATAVVTVSALPSSIGGATSVCVGATITLSDFTPGGAWTSTSGVSVTTGTTVTTVTGLTAGTNTVTYSLGSGCFKTYAVTVKPLPTPILGNLAVCGIGSVTFLSDATTGVSWTISPVGTATISPSGRVYGVSAGTATVTYTGTNGCIITAIVSVNPLLVVSPILGANNVGHLLTITLSDATPGGIWSSSNSALGSVSATGVVTGVGTAGVVVITYTVPYPAASGCAATATKSITVHTPAPHDHGTAITNIGAAISLGDDAMGGEWTSSDNSIATVDANGTVTGIAVGSVIVTHLVTGSDGAISATITQIVVNPVAFEVRLQPNPNKGTFTLNGSVGTNRDEAVTLVITNMLGQVVYSGKGVAKGGIINEQILLNSNLTNGMYLLNVQAAAGSKVFHFVLEK